MESVWIFKLGLSSLMKSISNTKQSNLLWHFLKTVNWLSLKRNSRNFFNLKMILRNVLSQFFIVKCFSKSLPVRIKLVLKWCKAHNFGPSKATHIYQNGFDLHPLCRRRERCSNAYFQPSTVKNPHFF